MVAVGGEQWWIADVVTVADSVRREFRGGLGKDMMTPSSPRAPASEDDAQALKLRPQPRCPSTRYFRSTTEYSLKH